MKKSVRIGDKQINLDALLRTVDLRLLLGVERMYCAWHDDRTTPNMVIYPDHGYCFACGKRADQIELVSVVEGLSFIEAVKYIIENKNKTLLIAHWPLPPLENEYVDSNMEALIQLADDSRAWTYLRNRGIYAISVQAFRLGFNGKEILIPHYVDHTLVNVKHRILPRYQKPNQPTYRSLAGRPLTQLWPHDKISQYAKSSKTLILTEGEFDAMILWQEQLPAVSVPSGVNARLAEWYSSFSQFERVLVAIDQDDAGDAAWERFMNKQDVSGHTDAQILAEACSTEFVRVQWPRNWGKDITDARTKLVPKLKRWLDDANYHI